MPTYRSITYETEPIDDYKKKPPRYASQPPGADDDIFSRETVSRRQDQRIKDDITNKLYRIEMDRVKPCFNVQLQTGFRKTTTLPKRGRHYSPESREPVQVSNTDRRRYSMAGNLNLYRAPTQYIEDYSFNRPDPVSDVELKSAMVLFGSGQPKNGPTTTYHYNRTYDSRPGLDYVDEYQLRKQAESKVRGRSVGPITTTTTYSPITTYGVSSAPRPRTISTPPDYYRTVVRPLPTNRQHAEVSTAGRKLSDSQYELDEFERLMRKTFGHGGVNRNSTLLYASPPVPRTYSYGSLPTYAPYSSYSSYGYPSYSGSYPYVPASRYSSYYSGPTYYSGNVTTYPTYSYPSYSYVEQRPVEYDYPLYSPPTRVTGPSEYSTYYDRDLYGGRSIRLPYTTTSSYNYVR